MFLLKRTLIILIGVVLSQTACNNGDKKASSQTNKQEDSSKTTTQEDFSKTMDSSKIDFRIGQPVYGGNGCPAGAGTVSSSSKKTHIKFDPYQIEVGGKTNRNSRRKKCDISIPVHVPTGWQFSLIDVNYHGSLNLPEGSSATLRRDYFFAGRVGPDMTDTWKGEINKEYSIKDHISTLPDAWSVCGSDTNLRIKTILKVKTPDGQAASASVNFAPHLALNFVWKRCK